MARRPRPVFCQWDGEVFKPHPRFKAYCDREYVVGETYPMMPVEEQSSGSRGYYFASLKEGFLNLSEENAKRFPSVEHLRKWCLVQCGYASQADFALANSKEARKLAADIRMRDPYAVIQIRDSVVRVFTAESQSPAAMKKERFEQSKNDVLDLVSSMSRTTRSQLEREGRKHGR
jgi:hypothetical protein